MADQAVAAPFPSDRDEEARAEATWAARILDRLAEMAMERAEAMQPAALVAVREGECSGG